MRTQRRTPTIATRFAPVLASIGLLGVGMVAGAQPASAAAAQTDCASTSIGPDGMLSAELLRDCLDQVVSTLVSEPANEPAEVPAPAAPAVEAAEVYVDLGAYAALDAVFAVDVPFVDEIEIDLVVEAEAEAPDTEGPSDAFAALIECESGGDYSINTGNGYYGAYQFSLETWQGLGYGGYPHEASPAVQDQAARELQAAYGWGQWPGCSWYLGLG